LVHLHLDTERDIARNDDMTTLTAGIASDAEMTPHGRCA
jgi:hypothetical protein